MNQRHSSYDRRECFFSSCKASSTDQQPLTTTIVEYPSRMQGQQHSQTNHKFNGYLMRRHQPSSQEAHWIRSMATAKLLALRSLQPVAPEGHEIPGPHGDSGCNIERQMVHLARLTLDHFQPVSRILQAGATAHISVS